MGEGNELLARAFSFIRLPARMDKPRSTGLTLILDKGLTLQEAVEFSKLAGPYVDIVKMGWGTARLLGRAVVAAKAEAYQASGIGVCPGGTFLEVAAAQGQVTAFLREANALGFTHIEVSDGVVQLGDRKLEFIRQAVEMGFRVISEVGRKSAVEDSRLDIMHRIAAIRAEIAAGAWKVIIEGRESGTVGIYDAGGHVKTDMVERICEGADPDQLIWEAPHKSQQLWLVQHFGARVNLANIAPADVLSVETLRVGLRGDTLRQYHVDPTTITIELGPQGALEAARRGDIVVVIDTLRASSTIVTALAHGMRAVIPVTSVDECVGEVTAGERGGKKIASLMHDNSPTEFASAQYAGKELVLTSTNGTECIRVAGSVLDSVVLVGSLLNAGAVALFAYRCARERGRCITLLVAGRNNQIAPEDLLTASEIASCLPTCDIRGNIELAYSPDYARDFLSSDSGANLVVLGKREDVLFCARKDVYDTVPIWKHGRLMPAGALYPVDAAHQ